MKIGKLALAAVLAAGTVMAYVWFPNPLELAADGQAAAPDRVGPDVSPPDEAPDAGHPAGAGESM